MRRIVICLSAMALLASDVAPASAAWNNVFQPTLFFRRRPTTSNYVAVPAVVYSSPVAVVAQASPVCNTCAPTPVVAQASPCPTCPTGGCPTACPPTQSCTTNYVQRCYYQPVTTYQQQTYYEPVTTTQTSYYYEPVTSYRYSCYYDACSCSYQQVAVPTTSYQLRAQSCPVQSWVQRCAQVPVTTYQKSCYMQPQTTCCQTTAAAPVPVVAAAPAAPCPTCPQQAAPAYIPPQPNYQQPPQYQAPPPGNPPIIDQNRAPSLPSTAPGNNQYYPPMNPSTSWRPSTVSVPAAVTPAPVKAPTPPPPSVKLDRIVVGPDSRVDGQVVRSDNTPRANSQVLFVSAQVPGVRETTATNDMGRFSTSLATGGWYVYLTGVDGNLVYHSRIDVTDNQVAKLMLVSR